MRATRLLCVLALATGIMGAPNAAEALPAPAGSFSCGLYFGVVFPPVPLSQVSTGRGVFGSTVGVPSGVSCTGSITGTASVTGVTTFCPPKGDEATCPARVGTFPDAAPVFTTANGLPASLFASVYAEAILTPDAGTGLRYADDPGLTRGLVTCTLIGRGVGSAVLTLGQHTTVTCRGSNESTSTTYTGLSNVTEQVLLWPAGNLVTSSEPGFEQLCPDPTTTLNPNDFQCFRSVLLEGSVTLTSPGLV